MAGYDISHMRPFDPKSGDLNVIIETPRGRRTKFKYDGKYNLFIFDKALPIGQSFPFDFGFLPSTIGEDGDPLDALVLTDEPTFVGCLVLAKLLGVIEAEQIEDGETKRNDRFIAVPIEAKSRKPLVQSIARLEPTLAKSITKFFIAYNELQGKEFKTLGVAGPDRAMELIREGFAKASRGRRRKRSSNS